MAIALDGFRALRRIGKQRELFGAARVEADKAARAIVLKCLKAKSTDVSALRAIHDALPGKAFALILEAMSDADVRIIVARLDKHHLAKSGEAASSRQHLVGLASGEIEPTEGAIKPRKASAKNVAKPQAARGARRFKSAVMETFKQGGRDDD